MDESTQPPPASTSHSEARNLLLLQDYVRNVSQAQLMLEQTSASLQRTENLTGIFSEHDLRTLRTACQVQHLQSLLQHGQLAHFDASDTSISVIDISLTAMEASRTRRTVNGEI